MSMNQVLEEAASLHDLSWGYRAARVLHVASALDVFTILSGKRMSADEIALATGAKTDMTEKLLLACTAMALLEKRGSDYRNTELAERFLVRGSPLFQGDIIAHSASVWNFWHDLENQVRGGRSALTRMPHEHRNFILGMHNLAVAGRARMFVDTVDLSGRGKLFDVGGGPGTYSIAACRRYLQLRAVVFDLPETGVIAREVIAREGMNDRVRFQAGDWQSDDFGSDNDVVLLSNVLHGPQSGAEMKLRKAYDSLVGGGLLVVQEFLLNDEKTGPLIPALFNVMVGAYSAAELLALIEDTGFASPEVIKTCEKIGCSWITASKQAP
jgi:SAM-dependent methyltransferase